MNNLNEVVSEEYFDVSKITRFEVIDGGGVKGRSTVAYCVNVDIKIQDEGRTMKVFLSNREG